MDKRQPSIRRRGIRGRGRSNFNGRGQEDARDEDGEDTIDIFIGYTNVGRGKGGGYIITCYKCDKQGHKNAKCLVNQNDGRRSEVKA